MTAIASHKGMMLLESFGQDCLRVTLRFTWQNYLHAQLRKRQVGLSLWKDADCCRTPRSALWSLVELCPKPRWLVGIPAVQGCEGDMHKGGISWWPWFSERANHRKWSLLCQKNRLDDPLRIQSQTARDAVKCGYSKALHLVLFIYTFKTHTQNWQVEQSEPRETFPPAAPLLLIFFGSGLCQNRIRVFRIRK